MKKQFVIIALVAGTMASCGEATVETVVTDAQGVTNDVVDALTNNDLPEHIEEVKGDDPTVAKTVLFEEAEWSTYGYNKDFDASSSVMVKDALAATDKVGEEMVIKASVNQVCQKAGCWVEVGDFQGAEMMVYFKDHFTIPIEGTPGKNAMLHGVTRLDTTSVKFQKHLLDDRAEKGDTVAQEEYDAITEPIIETVFIADGIMLPKED